MGSWSVYCGISNIAITAGSRCAILPIKRDRMNYRNQFVPATLPIFGKYDDYGGLENIERSQNTRYIEEFFNCTIEEFCRLFTMGNRNRGVDGFPEHLIENEVCKDWEFFFIEGEVYDFMSTHVPRERLSSAYIGSGKLLEYLGFTYLGENSEPRYKFEWERRGVRVKSDGTWLHSETDDLIYSFDDLANRVPIDQSKHWVGDRHAWQLWHLLEVDKRPKILAPALGVSDSYFDRMEFQIEMNKMQPDSEVPFKIRRPPLEEFTMGYLDDLMVFGEDLAALITLQSNLYPMSGHLRPHQLYVTPQCGEYAEHQIILEKFAEINRGYLVRRGYEY